MAVEGIILFLICLVAVVSCYRFDFVILAFPLFIPLYLVKGVFFGVPFTVLELYVYVLFFVGLILEFKREKWKFVFDLKCFFRDYKWLLVLVLFFLIGSVFSFYSVKNIILFDDGHIFEGLKVYLGILKGWILAPILFLLISLYKIDTKKKIFSMLNFYLLSSVFLSLLAIYQVITGNYLTFDGRASGPFESANYLALYIVPAFIYVAFRIKETVFSYNSEDDISLENRIIYFKKYRFLKLTFFVLAFLIIVFAILFSKSYMGILSSFLGVLFYLFFDFFFLNKNINTKKYLFLTGGVISVFLIFSLFFLYFSDQNKWNVMFKFDERNSSSVRLEVYKVSFDLIKENWFFGVGLGQYEAMYKLNSERFLNKIPYELNMLHPHNLFFSLWLNSGFIGFISFLCLMFLIFKNFFIDVIKNNKLDNNLINKIYILSVSLLFSILVFGMFDTPFYKNDLAVIFWFIVGIIFVSKNNKKLV